MQKLYENNFEIIILTYGSVQIVEIMFKRINSFAFIAFEWIKICERARV
jgi:hypothetical protein